MSLESFNALTDEEVSARLAACLPVGRWVAEVKNSRPYAAQLALLERARAAAAELSDDELAAALAGHPRIGERPSSPDHNATASQREQAGVDPADAEVRARLEAGNAAYERRFDRVFIIRAAGRSAPEILEELQRRLRNDDATEREETVAQLREIALLRLEQVV